MQPVVNIANRWFSGPEKTAGLRFPIYTPVGDDPAIADTDGNRLTGLHRNTFGHVNADIYILRPVEKNVRPVVSATVDQIADRAADRGFRFGIDGQGI